MVGALEFEAGASNVSSLTPIAVEMKPLCNSQNGEELLQSTEDPVPRDGRAGTEEVELGIRDACQPPESAVNALQQWNNPRINMWRVFACCWSFFIAGGNDGAYGALIPYLETYYDLSYTVVSLIFLSPFVGYSLASLLNNAVHVKFGQRGVAVIGAACHLTTYVVVCTHPPYPVMVIAYIVVGFGNGIVDAAWCAWIANMVSGNQVSGFLQASYSLGATIAPLIATAMITRAGWPWWTFYYFMVGGSAIELAVLTAAFWKQTGEVFRLENPRDPSVKVGRTREALSNRLTWIFAIFILGYVGAEVSLGGWIVVFMAKVRSASKFDSGMSATGFWAGMTVGRLVLGFATEKFGERLSVIIYLAIAVGLELIFWLVPSIVVSAIAVAFLGFIFGPLFPTATVLLTKMLPKHLHVGSIGFATAFGGSGGAIFPFIVGAIASAKGVKVLQPVILALLALISALWLMLPRLPQKDHEAEAGKKLQEFWSWLGWERENRNPRD
ncbi:hypothetical protein BP5796_09917 [Coleophoma crateriformis]|uniref:Major facilitator superfamily (MFS) profile domain-containing protein n=1 Tax=Coleophoma crateriformis TaxID=565419 RepID=A0A3D8QTX3_9HELO|nr:hypothetical protein BP5796_09917 [Coleophoma crateriformis]